MAWTVQTASLKRTDPLRHKALSGSTGDKDKGMLRARAGIGAAMPPAHQNQSARDLLLVIDRRLDEASQALECDLRAALSVSRIFSMSTL